MDSETPSTSKRPGGEINSPFRTYKKGCFLHDQDAMGNRTGSRCSSRNSRMTMTMAEPRHSYKLLSGLNQLRQSGELCDYTILAENTSVKVHKVVMAACSDYFKAMLTGEMREAHENSVELRGVSADGLNAVVTFAYTGKLDISLDSVEEILAAACHLQILQVESLCCQYFETSITEDNCTDILNMAEFYSLAPTTELAKQFILDYFENLTDQFYKMNASQLAYILSKDNLQVSYEITVFNKVLEWIRYDAKTRGQYVDNLMPHVRLPLLTGEELVEKVSKYEIMKENRKCQELLTEAKDYHIMVSKQSLFQTPRTQVRSSDKSIVMCVGENLKRYNLMSRHQGYLREAIQPLHNPCVVVVDNYMYACGGKYDDNQNNDIATARCFRYDPRFDSWFELTPMNEARKDFVLVACGDKLYAIGGQDENVLVSSVECFFIQHNEWSIVSSLQEALYNSAGAVCNSLIYVAGGQLFDGITNDLKCYDPVLDRWSLKAPLLSDRMNHVMECINSKLYIVGGNIEDPYGFPTSVTSIECYDVLIDEWTVCKATLNVREAGSCTVNVEMFIIGGLNGQHYYSDLINSYKPGKDNVDITGRCGPIYGGACCVLTLPNHT